MLGLEPKVSDKHTDKSMLTHEGLKHFDSKRLNENDLKLAQKGKNKDGTARLKQHWIQWVNDLIG